MNIKAANTILDGIRRDDLKSKLPEAKIEDRLVSFFEQNFDYENSTMVQHKVEGGKIDVVLQAAGQFFVVVEVKQTGKISDFGLANGTTKRDKILIIKDEDKTGQARYVYQINQNRKGFGILTDSEKWVVFYVEPYLGNYLVIVLLEFEAVTSETVMVIENNTTKDKALSREDLDYFDYQQDLTNAILPRLQKAKIKNFFEFLLAAHKDMKWREFNALMQLSLDHRVVFFKEKCLTHWHSEDEKFVRAFYGNARFAADSAKRIIRYELLILPDAS